jgi:hypothetical protein
MRQGFASVATVEIMPSTGNILAGDLARHCKQQWPRPPMNSPLTPQPGQELELVFELDALPLGPVGWEGRSQLIVGLWRDQEEAGNDRYDRILPCVRARGLEYTVPIQAFPVGFLMSDRIHELDTVKVVTSIAAWSIPEGQEAALSQRATNQLHSFESTCVDILVILRMHRPDRYLAIEVAGSSYDPENSEARLRHFVSRTHPASLLSVASAPVE